MTGWIQTAYQPSSKSLPENPVDLQKLFVCVGPGSYVGMRQAVSFAKAIQSCSTKLLTPSSVKTKSKLSLLEKSVKDLAKIQIISFTIFDLFLLLAKQQLADQQVEQGQLLIKAWPRDKITNQTPTEKIRVYVDTFRKKGNHYVLANNHQLINLTDLKVNSALYFITNLSQTITKRFSIKKKLLLAVTLTEDLQAELIPQLKPASYNLEPIYINPPSYEKSTSTVGNRKISLKNNANN